MPIASPSRRVAAFLIDYAPVLVAGQLASQFGPAWIHSLAILAFFVVRLLGHALWGQTPGKLLLRVRVVENQDRRVRWRTAALRDLPYWLLYGGTTLGFSVVLGLTIDIDAEPEGAARGIVSLLYVAVALAGFALADIGFALFGGGRRAIHDRIAGTRVVATEPTLLALTDGEQPIA